VAAPAERRDCFDASFMGVAAATHAAANGYCMAGFQHGDERLATLDILDPVGKVLLEQMGIVAADPYAIGNVGQVVRKVVCGTGPPFLDGCYALEQCFELRLSRRRGRGDVKSLVAPTCGFQLSRERRIHVLAEADYVAMKCAGEKEPRSWRTSGLIDCEQPAVMIGGEQRFDVQPSQIKDVSQNDP
jgi:hypothetical protein